MLWKTFTAVKRGFCTIHCIAYVVPASSLSSVSPWGLGRSHRLGGNRGDHLYTTAARHGDTNRDDCWFNGGRWGLSCWWECHAEETEKVEDWWKRLFWDICARTKLKSTNCKEGFYEPIIIYHSIRYEKLISGPQQSKGNCVAVMRTYFHSKGQNKNMAQHYWKRIKCSKPPVLHWPSPGCNHPTYISQLSHSIAIQKLQGKATIDSPPRHWGTTEVIRRLIASTILWLSLHPKPAEKLPRKLLRLFAKGKIHSFKFWKQCKPPSMWITFKLLKPNTLFCTVRDLA